MSIAGAIHAESGSIFVAAGTLKDLSPLRAEIALPNPKSRSASAVLGAVIYLSLQGGRLHVQLICTVCVPRMF